MNQGESSPFGLRLNRHATVKPTVCVSMTNHYEKREGFGIDFSTGVEPAHKDRRLYLGVAGQPYTLPLHNGSFRQNSLRYLAALNVFAVLPLDDLHLVFEPQFQLLQSDFFEFLVVGKITLVGKRGEPLLILRVLLGQPAEFLVRGQEMVSRGKHPTDLLLFNLLLETSTGAELDQRRFSSEIYAQVTRFQLFICTRIRAVHS
jgi:hypothetical protein